MHSTEEVLTNFDFCIFRGNLLITNATGTILPKKH